MRRASLLVALAVPAMWAVPRVALAEPDPPPEHAAPVPSGPVPSAPAAPPEPPAEPAKKSAEPVEVRVIGDKADSLPKVPGSGTLVGAKEMKRAEPVQTSEMLRRVPGILAREDYGGGGRIDISVRGLEAGRSRRVLLLEDGMPLALNPYSEPDMYYAPPVERYRAIEVVKGSGNILFGPQTLAGTINFVTLAPPTRTTLVADADVGTYGYARGLARYGDAIGDTRYVVQVLHRRGDGFRDLPFASTDALGKISFPTGENGTAVVKLGFHRDDAASDDIGLTAAMYRTDPKRASLSSASHLLLDRYDVSLTHEQRLADDVQLKTLAYAYRTSRVWRRQDYTRTPSATDVYTRIVGDTTTPGGAVYFQPGNVVLDRSYDVLGVEPRLTVKVKTAAVRHTFEVGGRVLSETAAYEQRQGTYAETYVGSLDNAEHRRGVGLAAYLEDRIAFTDRLLVTPGVRFEHLAYERTILRGFQNSVATDLYQQGQGDISGIIPGIGLVYGTRAAHGFFGLHRGYAPPRVTSSVSARGVPSSVGADESSNFEVGARVSPVKWTRLEATGFLSSFQNQVIANTNPSADVNLVDAGATTIRGVESAAAIDFAKPLGWATAVELGVRYTYSRATFRFGPNGGNVLPYAPEHTGSANLDIEHPSGLGGQIAATYIGRQFTDELDTRAEDVTGRVGLIDAATIVDANAHYRHKPSGLTLRLTVKNALDTTYISARRPEGIQPGAFRLVLLGLRWEWEKKEKDVTP